MFSDRLSPRIIRASIVLVIVFALCSRSLAAEAEHDHGHDDEDHDDDHAGENGYEYIAQISLPADTYTLQLSKLGGSYFDTELSVLFMKVDDDWEDHLAELEEVAAALFNSSAAVECGHDDEHGDEDEDDDEDHDEHEHEAGHVECVSSGSIVTLDMVGGTTFFIAKMDIDAPFTHIKVVVPKEGDDHGDNNDTDDDHDHRRRLLQLVSWRSKYLVFMSHAAYEFQDGNPWLLTSSGEDVEVEDVKGGYKCIGNTNISATWGYAMLGSVCGSAMAVIGILFILPVMRDYTTTLFPFLRALASGVLLSLVIVHLIPESMALTGAGNQWRASTCVMGGFAAAFVLEHLLLLKANSSSGTITPKEDEDEEGPKTTPPSPTLRPHAALQGVGADEDPVHWDEESASTQARSDWIKGQTGVRSPKMTALMWHILLGDFFHNFFDGVVIAIAFRVCGNAMGWTVVVSVIIHEAPQEISDFFILVQAGLPAHKALLFNLASSLSSILGVCAILPVTIAKGGITREVEHSMGLVLGIGAGFLLYISIELIPSILKVKKIKDAAISWLFFAVGAVAIGLTLLQHVHCECDGPAPAAGEDPHAGHNH